MPCKPIFMEAERDITIWVHNYLHVFTFTVTHSRCSRFYTRSCLFLCTDSAEACLSIAGIKDMSVLLIHLQFNFL